MNPLHIPLAATLAPMAKTPEQLTRATMAELSEQAARLGIECTAQLQGTTYSAKQAATGSILWKIDGKRASFHAADLSIFRTYAAMETTTEKAARAAAVAATTQPTPAYLAEPADAQQASQDDAGDDERAALTRALAERDEARERIARMLTQIDTYRAQRDEQGARAVKAEQALQMQALAMETTRNALDHARSQRDNLREQMRAARTLTTAQHAELLAAYLGSLPLAHIDAIAATERRAWSEGMNGTRASQGPAHNERQATIAAAIAAMLDHDRAKIDRLLTPAREAR